MKGVVKEEKNKICGQRKKNVFEEKAKKMNEDEDELERSMMKMIKRKYEEVKEEEEEEEEDEDEEGTRKKDASFFSFFRISQLFLDWTPEGAQAFLTIFFSVSRNPCDKHVSVPDIAARQIALCNCTYVCVT